jgi:flagellar basal-body rod modification protein FlgD
MATSAVLNHSAMAAQALTGSATTSAKAEATSTSSSSTSSASISANDFLTLLVTELKNQDPTANSDPNEYVNQLVAVNSLEQLIDVNTTLSSHLGSTSTSTAAQTSTTGLSGTAAQTDAASSGSPLTSAIHTAASQLAPGNLSVPATNASAQNVAESLGGHRYVQ